MKAIYNAQVSIGTLEQPSQSAVPAAMDSACVWVAMED